jgi:DNA modification methylase
MEYKEFIKNKLLKREYSGFDIEIDEIHPMLFDWQKVIVQWAVRLGKAALFEECGAGKTLQQIEWARFVSNHTNGKVLILSPLAVAHQTIREGKKIDVDIEYVRSQEAAESSDCSIVITNYDMLDAFNGSYFAGVVLDESSILKSFTGATKRTILEMFYNTQFKLACTATPAPNDHLELGNHAEFLNVMPSNEMISRWFVNDSMQAGGYRLKGHAEKDYWKWVTSWAVCLSLPSDLGYPDDGFALPELKMQTHIVAVDQSRAWKDGRLIVDGMLSATGMWKEKKETAHDRCLKAAEIIGESEEKFIVWCDTNVEADYLVEMLKHKSMVEIRGSDSIKEKERKLNLFSDGKVNIIISKCDIAGFGLNWQHCHNMIFVGVTYSFEKTYQGLRRSWRFGQTEPVNAHLIYAESEGDIYKTILHKQGEFKIMQKAMNDAMATSGLVRNKKLELRENVEQDKESGESWEMYLGDSCQVINSIPDNSIDFSIYSPPFSNLYIYSDALQDMGNSTDDEEFFEHYKYLISEMHRVTVPGRLSAVHCKDLPLYHGRDGAAGLKDFPGMIIRAHEECGWTYHSRVTIWKDPVIEMQRTKNHGLLHKNFLVRGEVCRQGMADYLIVFRKWEGVEGTESIKPVTHEAKEMPYAGEEPPTYFDSERDYTIQLWQKYASPVWFDINQTNVLNGRLARENGDEKHICPLQLDVIERSIQLWTNKGDLVYSPFAGIGSEGYVSIKLGRRFVGMELKRSYFQQAVKYLKQAEFEKSTPTLFDFDALVKR